MKLSIRAMTFASAFTALVMILLTLPLHLMQWGWMGGMMYRPGRWPGGSWMHGMMTSHAGFGGWPFVAWILLAIAVVMVYAGIIGAIFAAIYNAFAPKQP